MQQNTVQQYTTIYNTVDITYFDGYKEYNVNRAVQVENQEEGKK